MTSTEILAQAEAKGFPLDFPIAVRQVAAIKSKFDGAPIPVEAAGQHVIVRYRDAAPLVLGACKSGYTPVRTREALSFLDKLRADGAPLRYERAGELRQGRRVFVQALVGANWVLRRPDGSEAPQAQRVTFCAGHDGSFGLHVGLSEVAIVCENTFAAAAQQCAWSAKHTASVTDRLKLGVSALRTAIESRPEVERVLHTLDSQPMSERAFGTFAVAYVLGLDASSERDAVAQAAPILDTMSDAIRTRTERAISDLHACFTDRKMGALGETRYDALMAVTEYLDHQRGRVASAKESVQKLWAATESLWYGDGAKKKSRALRMLTNW